MNKQSEACRYEHVYQAIDDIRGTAEVLKKYCNVPTKEALMMATKTVCRSAGLDEKPLLKLCGEEKPYTNHTATVIIKLYGMMAYSTRWVNRKEGH